MRVEVQVRRKIRDLVRDAAEDALRARWPALGNVDRAEVWEFTLAPGISGEGGTEEIRRLLEETTLVANPNVHRWTVRRADDVGAVETSAGASIHVSVRDRVDAKSKAVLRSVRERLGLGGVEEVRRSVRWTIELAGSRNEAERLAREVTGLDGSGAGLLANPHAQDVETGVTAT